MKKDFLFVTVLGLAAAVMAFGQAAPAPTPAPPAAAPAGAPAAAPAATGGSSKIAIIQLQQALLKTQEGLKASADMNAKFGTRRSELEKRNTDLTNMQDQLSKGSATMNDAAKAKLANDIATGQKRLQRDGEDFDAEVQTYENGLMQEMVTKMVDIIGKYATQNGYAMVVDVSNQQSPLIWADQANVITEPIVKLYDQAHPAAVPTAAKPPAAPPAAPPVKKQ